MPLKESQMSFLDKLVENLDPVQKKKFLSPLNSLVMDKEIKNQSNRMVGFSHFKKKKAH